jgi:hypothetical protein
MTARPDLGHVMTRQHYERLAAELAAELAGGLVVEPTAPCRHRAGKAAHTGACSCAALPQ